MRLSSVSSLLYGLVVALAHGEICPGDPTRNTCPAVGSTIMSFSGCSMVVENLEDLSTCFDDVGRSTITSIYLQNNALTTLRAGLFAGMTSMTTLILNNNGLTTLPAGVFTGLHSLNTLHLNSNGLTTLPTGPFSELTSLTSLSLNMNSLTTLPRDLFSELASLIELSLASNSLTTLPTDLFSKLTSLRALDLGDNELTTLATGLFSGLTSMEMLFLQDNLLTTLPTGLFSGLTSLTTLFLDSSVDCIPNNDVLANPEGNICECTLSDDLLCGDEKFCVPGNDVTPGYACAANVDRDAGTEGDPHMIGLRGQKIDWKGEDGGWYALLSDDRADFMMSVRLTAPLPVEYPDRQLMTGFAMRYEGGHSVVLEIKDPYTTETDGCPKDMHARCLSDNALKLTIDGEEQLAVPTEHTYLEGGAKIMASNLPAECRPYGGDAIWATTFSNMAVDRHLVGDLTLDEWVLDWSATTAAPAWCEKFIAELGAEGLLDLSNKHTVFRIETLPLTVRLHSGTNHQGGEVLDDGRTLPHLKFWQMDIHIEYFDLNTDTVTGILGETVRPVLDATGQPIMSGSKALRGEVEDYRISCPLMSDFDGFHE